MEMRFFKSLAAIAPGSGFSHDPVSDGGIDLTLSARSVDGFGNNRLDPSLGSAGHPLLRLSPARYADDVGAMVTDRPNPRSISNAVVREDEDIPNRLGASNLLWGWGQFIDHDLSLTRENEEEQLPLPVPPGDDVFADGSIILFSRSETAPGTGMPGAPRQHENAITAFLDASMVYGSDHETADAVRGDGGRLLTGPGDLLPTTSDPDDDDGLIAGDVRAGENVVLTSLHTLFVREHNRLVDEISARHPDLDADDLYLAARARVEGLIQAITFNEFLPLLVGEGTVPDYAGYDPLADPSITTEFSTAVFRLGHSLLSSVIARTNEDGTTVAEGNLTLRESFEQPGLLEEAGGIAGIFRGTASTLARDLDTMIIEDVRSFLFAERFPGGLDLASLNIQRGRDHGLPAYNDLREVVGLPRATSFNDVSSDPRVQERLADAYASVDQVDAWIGGLAEDPVNGGMLGELFSLILVDQFVRVREGDRFWSEAALSDAEVAELWSTSLSDVIMRNTDVQYLQADALVAAERIMGSAGSDVLDGGTANDLLIGEAGADLMRGGTGDDALYGGAGLDLIIGGPGDDLLRGGSGGDSYVYAPGDGSDTIDDRDGGALDALLFGDGITIADVTMGFDPQDKADLLIGITPTGETIRVENQFAAGEEFGLDAIAFQNGPVITRNGVLMPQRQDTAAGLPLFDPARPFTFAMTSQDGSALAMDWLDPVQPRVPAETDMATGMEAMGLSDRALEDIQDMLEGYGEMPFGF